MLQNFYFLKIGDMFQNFYLVQMGDMLQNFYFFEIGDMFQNFYLLEAHPLGPMPVRGSPASLGQAWGRAGGEHGATPVSLERHGNTPVSLGQAWGRAGESMERAGATREACGRAGERQGPRRCASGRR